MCPFPAADRKQRPRRLQERCPNLTLNVSTAAPHQMAKQDAPALWGPYRFALAGVIVLFLPCFKRYRQYLICFIALVLASSLVACGGGGGGTSGGGGSSDPGTPVGAYSFTVTATTGSGTSLVTSSTQVQVTVN